MRDASDALLLPVVPDPARFSSVLSCNVVQRNALQHSERYVGHSAKAMTGRISKTSRAKPIQCHHRLVTLTLSILCSLLSPALLHYYCTYFGAVEQGMVLVSVADDER